MQRTEVLRTRVDARRKARVEKILSDLGLTATQAVNMFFAQIERRKGIPFPVTNDLTDIVPPVEHVAAIWDKLDNEDFSHLDKR